MKLPGHIQIAGNIKAANFPSREAFYLGNAEDVTTGGATDGQGVLFTAATGEWEPGDVGGDITFKDGTNEHAAQELNFNADDFYLSTDLGGSPVVNLYAPFRGALVRMTDGDHQSVGAGATAVITWDEAIYDTDGFFSGPSTDLTIPANSDIRRIRLTALVKWAEDPTVASQRQAYLTKDTGPFFGSASFRIHAPLLSAPILCPLVSSILSVSDGDTYQVYVINEESAAAKTVNAGNQTWFQLEVIE